MPLSEQEEQILQQIERSLYQEDPEFARQVGRRYRSRGQVVAVRLGIAGVVLGIVALIGFFVSRILVVGIVAFAAMVGGIVVLATVATSAIGRRLAESPSPRDRWATARRGVQERFKRRYRRY